MYAPILRSEMETDRQTDKPAIAVETIWALSFSGAHFDNNSVKLDCKPPFIIKIFHSF